MQTSIILGSGRFQAVRRLSARVRRLWYSAPETLRGGLLLSAIKLTSMTYRAGFEMDRRRSRFRRRRLPAYVVSVGNLAVGGTGKTPLTLWLARYFKNGGRRVAVLSRGYGRSGSAPGRVPSSGELSALALEYGDEPAMLALELGDTPVYVGKHRWESGILAIESSRADLVILDDGFQHHALERDLDLVLLDASNPFGNGFTLPLGPLREAKAHLARAHAIVLTRAVEPESVARTRAQLDRAFPEKPVFAAQHKLRGFHAGLGGAVIPLSRVVARPAVAFAGIADPQSFFSLLEALGIDLRMAFAFPDHHRPTARDTAALFDAVRTCSADLLITTQKDAVRLPGFLRRVVCVPELEIDFGEDEMRLRRFLDRETRGRQAMPD